jgi:hypothetical protein
VAAARGPLRSSVPYADAVGRTLDNARNDSYYPAIYANVYSALPTIVRKGSITLKVFFSDTMRHKAPHVHVYEGSECIAVVALLDLRPFVGGPLSRGVRELLKEHWETLWEAWDECNAS